MTRRLVTGLVDRVRVCDVGVAGAYVRVCVESKEACRYFAVSYIHGGSVSMHFIVLLPPPIFTSLCTCAYDPPMTSAVDTDTRDI